ncbi:apolipoprotein N-acyltransferase [Pelagibacteraceae bacterium]|nr:apolipoprotein N-acyltransferase [Pelagibacteraceae bacterium]
MLLQLRKLQSKGSFFFIAFILGIFLSLGFDPFNVPFTSLVIVGLFFKLNDKFYLIYQKSYKGFFSIGLAFGFGFFISSTYWISNALTVYGGMISYFLPLTIIVLPLVLGLFYGGMQILNCFLWDKTNAKIFYFSASWTIFEILRSFLFTGLPWNLISYSWSWSISFIQILSIVGPFGLGLISVLSSSAIFSLKLKLEEMILCSLGLLILISVFFYGNQRIISYNLTNISDEEIRIVGTHIEQKDKWSNSTRLIIKDLISDSKTTIIPETMSGTDLFRNENLLQGYLRKEGSNYFNSIAFKGHIYDKKHLVPFGEYVPFKNIIDNTFLSKFINTSSLMSGEDKYFPTNIIPLICYEGIFPNIVAKNRKKGANLIVNITNDSWFGKNTGPRQHFTHIRFRAVEEGLPLIRSSNMGFSGMVDPFGKVVKAVESNTNSFIEIKILEGVDTFYSKYRYKVVYFLIAILLIIGYLIQIYFKKNRL